MIRCGFIGHDAIYDEALPQKLATELEKLVQQGEDLEFWFYKHTTAYFRLCLALVVWLRTKYPDRSIKLIRAFRLPDGVGRILDYNRRTDSNLPRCIIDQNVCIPLADTPASKNVYYTDRFDRWLINHCDYLFAYCYPDIDRNVYHQLHYAKQGASIIQLSFADTATFIAKQINLLKERDQTVLSLLSAGVTQKSIAQTLDISVSRVSSIAKEAGYKIRRILKKRFQEDHLSRSVFCGLICLDHAPVTVDQMILFECLLTYLLTEGVTTFQIDEQSYDTIYGKVLTTLIAKNTHASIKIFSATLPNYHDVVRKSHWIIIDHAHAQATAIKDLCHADGRTLLIDIADDKRKINTLS